MLSALPPPWTETSHIIFRTERAHLGLTSWTLSHPTAPHLSSPRSCPSSLLAASLLGSLMLVWVFQRFAELEDRTAFTAMAKVNATFLEHSTLPKNEKWPPNLRNFSASPFDSRRILAAIRLHAQLPEGASDSERRLSQQLIKSEPALHSLLETRTVPPSPAPAVQQALAAHLADPPGSCPVSLLPATT